MKAIFTTFFVAFGLVSAQAQCPTGNDTLSTQAEVDAFGVNWPNCTDFPANLYIIGADITNLSGLQNLSYVGGNLQIIGNNALTGLTGLENLSSVGGYLKIYYNDALTSLSGLESLSSVGGYLHMSHNFALTSLGGLLNLISVGGSLSISSHTSLTSLGGLGNLNSVGGYLFISNNDALTSLAGLGSLSSAGGSLFINNNDALASLVGLENPSSLSEDLFIYDNPNLPICNTSAICQYLQSYDPSVQVVEIYNNAVGCNSEEDILLACTDSVINPMAKMPLQALPNPTRNTATVFFEGSSRTKVQLLNTLGSVIQQHEVSGSSLMLDVSALPSGVYFVRATSGAAMGTAKLVKE